MMCAAVMKASAQNLKGKVSEPHISNVSMLSFCRSILFVCVRAYETMMDAKISGELFET